MRLVLVGVADFMTTSQLINQIVEHGGCIVTSDKCSEIEIADAQATGRFAVDAENGYGFVRRYEEWLQKAMKHSREHADS